MARTPDRSTALIEEDQLAALNEPFAHLVEHEQGSPLVALDANPAEIHLTVDLSAGPRWTRRAFSIRRVQREVQVPDCQYRFYETQWRLHAYTHVGVGVNNKQVKMGTDVRISPGDVISLPRAGRCDKRPVRRAVAVQGDLPVPANGPRWVFRANRDYDAAAGRLLLASSGADLRGLDLPRWPLSDVLKRAESERCTPGEIVLAETGRCSPEEIENKSPHAGSPHTEPRRGWRRKRGLSAVVD